MESGADSDGAAVDGGAGAGAGAGAAAAPDEPASDDAASTHRWTLGRRGGGRKGGGNVVVRGEDDVVDVEVVGHHDTFFLEGTAGRLLSYFMNAPISNTPR